MALEGNDLAILTARFGCARFGASRFGFVPCPEDVAGVGMSEPGEYIWKEEHFPVTEWTLVTEDCVCRNLCTLALGVITVDQDPIVEDVDVTASVTLSGVLGQVSGVARINWGDGKHDEQQFVLLEDGVIQFTNHYHVGGDYTITITVTDERGCKTAASLDVTVGSLPDLLADFTIDVNEQGATGGSGIQTTGWSGDSTVSGGSGSYSYEWTIWNEYSSEIAPLYTSIVADPNFVAPISSCCVGQATLVVTDTVTLLTVSVGPYDWNWDCI